MNRFLDNGDGTVTDSETGLMWTTDANLFSTTKTWQEAIDYCKNLSIEGYSGWRLPSVKELLSLIDYATYNPALPADHPFLNVQPSYYWSSTAYASNPYCAWVVGMWYGGVDFDGKSYYYYYVWPVRGLGKEKENEIYR